MATISASELERVISALPNRRVLDFKPVRPHSSEFLANQRKLAERIRLLLAKSIELEKIEKMLADNENEQRRLIEKEKADAYNRLPKIEDTFRHQIDERFKAFELANLIVKPPTIVVLDTPTYIHATPTSMLTASHIQPRNSTAQIKYATPGEGYDYVVRLGFYFVWENSSANPVLLENVASQLVIKGLWETGAASIPFPDIHTTDVWVFVGLDLIEWWPQPPTRLNGPYAQSAHLQTDGFDAWPGPNSQDYKYLWVFNSYDLSYSSLTVPPNGSVLFEAYLSTVIDITGGTCFASITIQGDDSSVLCPFLQFKASELIHHGPPL
jgi:hypothetical protein